MKIKRPTTKIPDGTKNLSINMPVEEVEDVRALAKASEMSMGEYVRALIYEARRDDVMYKLVAERISTKGKPSSPVPLVRGRRGSDFAAEERQKLRKRN